AQQPIQRIGDHCDIIGVIIERLLQIGRNSHNVYVTEHIGDFVDVASGQQRIGNPGAQLHVGAVQELLPEQEVDLVVAICGDVGRVVTFHELNHGGGAADARDLLLRHQKNLMGELAGAVAGDCYFIIDVEFHDDSFPRLLRNQNLVYVSWNPIKGRLEVD